MTEHVFDELPQVLTGEADRATVSAVATHLRECDDCRDELIGALVAHAALASSVKFAPELVRPDLAGKTIATVSEFPAAPDLTALFAQVRAEAEAEPVVTAGAHRNRSDHRPRRTWLVAAAAAVVLALGGGAVYAATGHNSGPSSRTLALSAFDQGTTPASAKLTSNDQMTIDASSLPALANGSYYEVWLTNPARTSMAPVGVLDADRKASITVPDSEMSTYAAVEVSVQDTAGVGAYSGHSVLRGSYS
jgi:hypothetical protein